MCRQQALIEVPVETLWELVGDVRRHPEWWPRIIDVQCEELEQGCTFRQVTKAAVGKIETDILRTRARRVYSFVWQRLISSAPSRS